MTLEDYSHCYQCNTKLKNVRAPRTSPKLCGECKGDGQSDNSAIKKIHKQLKAKNLRPSEDLIVEFVNWKIDLLSSLMEFKNNINH